MIASQSLEMIPPVLGRERTFGWYPPAHEQFAKVPYKTLAVLDDYSQFKVQQTVCDRSVEDKVISESAVEEGGTVLSSKLNAIRQDLTRRRIDPSIIRQCHIKKYDNINQYWNIPQNWKPKYPEPDFELFRHNESKDSVTISKDIQILPDETKSCNASKHEDLKQVAVDVPLKCSRVNSSCITNVEENTKQYQQIRISRRPYTAPGQLLKSQNRFTSPLRSSSNCQLSSGRSFSSNRPISSQKSNMKKVSSSQPSIPLSTYEADLEKYKWMMEVPGDVFCIKQPHIPEKQPYFHKIENYEIYPPELPMSKQNRDTFFYNTLPYQSMSFDISPNFTSEKFNAKKNLLRSQGKWNYSSKNFSFVY